MLVFAGGGCSRVDTLRLMHANEGTPVEWPVGATLVELELERGADGRLWLPVSVDGKAAVPFLLQPAAGAIALTGARPGGAASAAVGRINLSRELLPGVAGGRLVKRRTLSLGPLLLGDQSVLLVKSAEWPHGQPAGPVAGVLGYDLLRRFPLEIDPAQGRLVVHRRTPSLRNMAVIQRLAVLERLPYFEAWLEPARGPGRMLRLQFEPGVAAGICLDQGGRGGVVELAGRQLAVPQAPCDDSVPAARPTAGRDGVFGGRALDGLAVLVDYRGGQIAFRAAE